MNIKQLFLFIFSHVSLASSAQEKANCVNVGLDRHDFLYAGQSKGKH